MKNLNILGILLCTTALVLSSCHEELSVPEKGLTIIRTFIATQCEYPTDSTMTRVSLNADKSIDWRAGDEIFYYSAEGGAIGECTIAENCHSAAISAEVGYDDRFLTAAYGGSGITDNLQDSFILDGAIKAEQTGKFEDAYISVASTVQIENPALQFHCVNSIIKFTLERSDVSYVIFRASDGSALHSNGSIKLSVGGVNHTAAFTENQGYSIKVNTDGPGTFYISTLPQEIKGFTISCYGPDEYLVGRAEGTKTLNLKTNCISNLGTIDLKIVDEPEAVDLGLTVKWATCNLGASQPEEYGGFYQWAGTKDVRNTSIDVTSSNCPYHIGSDVFTGWTKYIPANYSSYWSGTGEPDNKTILDPDDDVVHVTLTGDWRMPTDAEWTKLQECCTWTWTDDYNGTGVAGYIVSKNPDDYTNSIFLPAAGWRNQKYHDGAGSWDVICLHRSIRTTLTLHAGFNSLRNLSSGISPTVEVLVLPFVLFYVMQNRSPECN